MYKIARKLSSESYSALICIALFDQLKVYLPTCNCWDFQGLLGCGFFLLQQMITKREITAVTAHLIPVQLARKQIH